MAGKYPFSSKPHEEEEKQGTKKRYTFFCSMAISRATIKWKTIVKCSMGGYPEDIPCPFPLYAHHGIMASWPAS